MANPFVFRKTKKRHRLTDIETKEVSLVDKGANQRKFAVIKSDTETNEMAKQSAEATLEAVTTGLTKLAELTEAVKTFVEKNETGIAAPVDEWTKTVQSFQPWMHDVLTTLGTETPAETVKDDEKVTTAEVVATGPGLVTPAADVVTTETVEVKTLATGTETVAVAAETVTATETVVVPAVTTETPTTVDPVATVDALVKSLAGLGATPTSVDVEKAITGYDGLYISGGLFVDAYDVEALAMVCNAICAAMGAGADEEAAEEAAMAKAADKVLAEVTKRTTTVAKRVTEAKKATDTDGKELKVVGMVLKALKDSLVKAEATKATTVTPVLDMDAVQKMIEQAVAKAVAPFSVETTSLKDQLVKTAAEKVELAKQLNAALSTPATRASSQETVNTSDKPTFTVRVNRNGIADYNETI